MNMKIQYKDENGIITPLFAALQYGCFVVTGVILLIKTNLVLKSSLDFLLFDSGLSLAWYGCYRLERYFIGVIE